MFVTTVSTNLVVDTHKLTNKDYNELKKIDGTIIFICRDENVPYFLENEIVFQSSRKYFLGQTFLFEDISEEFSIEFKNIILISRDANLIEEARLLSIGTVLIDKNIIEYDQIGKMPDFHLYSFDEVEDIMTMKQGYYTEVRTTLDNSNRPLSESGYVLESKLFREGYEIDILAGGRYFNTSDRNYILHQLSNRINKSKYDTSQQDLFLTCYTSLIRFLIENDADISISRVPSRLGKIDRFENITERIAHHFKVPNISETLVCRTDYPNHKGLSAGLRFQNVEDVFHINGNDSNYRDKHVVIIDDVITTGATAFECAKKYLLAGAKKVSIVVLAVNQFTNYFGNSELICEDCDSKMVMRISKNNSAFYGCTGYINGCKNTYNYITGRIKIIESLFETKNSVEF